MGGTYPVIAEATELLSRVPTASTLVEDELIYRRHRRNSPWLLVR